MRRSRRRRVFGRARIPHQYVVDQLEARTLLSVVVAPADAVTYAGAAGPLPPSPGHSYYVSGYDAQGNSYYPWTNASAVTPNLVNDLDLNVAPSGWTYTPQNDGGGINLLTNGLTQTQIGPSPGAAQPALGDGGSSDPSNNQNAVADVTAQQYSATYKLGTAGGATPSSVGYDLTEIDFISGSSDYHTAIQDVDVLVEPAGSTRFLSLSGGKGFSLTSVPDGQGGIVKIDRGSAQMALVNSTPGQPIATNVKAVELVVMNCETELRELVMTGAPSAAAAAGPPASPNTVSSTFHNDATVQITWGAVDNAAGYQILRSIDFNNEVAIGTVYGQTSFTDNSPPPNVNLQYRIIACGNGDSLEGLPSPILTTPSFGATMDLFQEPLWQGYSSVNQFIPQIDYSGGGDSPQFPLAAKFNPGSFSAMIQGKITTDLAGTYTFLANTDDNGYLYVNGQLVSSNPGTQSGQNAPATSPISLSANTAYDFVFLENNASGPWAMRLYWSEPQADGSAGPMTVVPATSLSPTVDTPPVPQGLTATLIGNQSVQLNWLVAGDASSTGYEVERAPVNASGTIGYFQQIGKVFSGPGPNGVPKTWGATSFVDTTAMPNMTYAYTVSCSATPSAPSQPVAVPAAARAAVINGVLQITLATVANDDVALNTYGNQYVVSENGGNLASFDPSTVTSLLVAGGIGGTASSGQSFETDGTLSLPGTVSISGVSSIDLEVSATAVALQSTGSVSAGVETNGGPISIDTNALTLGRLASAGGPISISLSRLDAYYDSSIVNSGSGNVTYVIAASTSLTQAIENILNCSSGSGPVTIQSAAPVESISGNWLNPAFAGTLLFDFPGGNVTTTGIDTSSGNASLGIIADSLLINGPIKTGTGSLTLDASSIVVNGPITVQNAPISITSQSLQVNDPVSAGTGPLTLSSTAAAFGAATTVGSLTISSGDRVSINGPAITVSGSVSTAGQLTVAGGAQLQIGGSLSGSGGILVGNAAGSASPAATIVTAQSFSLPSVTIGPSGALDLAANAIPTASSTSSLSIAPGGRLDLANNLLDIGYSSGPDPMQTIRGYLVSGYANGTWNGWGIISSSAAGNPAAYGIGYADSADGNTFSRNADSIELRFTLNGDTNLDGTVNLADLTALARNFGKQGQWDTGDFNYDGRTDLSDFLILSREYDQSLASYPAPADADFLNDRLIARRAGIRPLSTNRPPQ